jgi:hypothetical protein
MVDTQNNTEDSPFNLQYQNAIFQFLFLLIEEYKTQMEPDQAVAKACDWLISLATTIKEKSLDITKENLDKSKLFKQAP